MAQAQEIIRERANGAISAILYHKERHVDEALSDDQAEQLRRVVLREVNNLVKFVNEVVESLGAEPTLTLNEHWLDKLNEIHRAVTNGRT